MCKVLQRVTYTIVRDWVLIHIRIGIHGNSKNSDGCNKKRGVMGNVQYRYCECFSAFQNDVGLFNLRL